MCGKRDRPRTPGLWGTAGGPSTRAGCLHHSGQGSAGTWIGETGLRGGRQCRRAPAAGGGGPGVGLLFPVHRLPTSAPHYSPPRMQSGEEVWEVPRPLGSTGLGLSGWGRSPSQVPRPGAAYSPAALSAFTRHCACSERPLRSAAWSPLRLCGGGKAPLPAQAHHFRSLSWRTGLLR